MLTHKDQCPIKDLFIRQMIKALSFAVTVVAAIVIFSIIQEWSR